MAWPNKTAEAERIVANFMVEVNINIWDADIAILLAFQKNIPSEMSPFYTHTSLRHE